MTTFQERSAALREKMEAPLPESWIPKTAGEELVGHFVRLDQGRTEAFGPAWIVVVETEKGEHRSVWLFHQALLNEFKRVRPVPGEFIGIRYGGKKPVKNPTPGRAATYHDWKVAVDREQSDATTDWGVLGGGGEEFAPVLEDTLAGPGGGDDDVPFERTFA